MRDGVVQGDRAQTAVSATTGQIGEQRRRGRATTCGAGRAGERTGSSGAGETGRQRRRGGSGWWEWGCSPLWRVSSLVAAAGIAVVFFFFALQPRGGRCGSCSFPAVSASSDGRRRLR